MSSFLEIFSLSSANLSIKNFSITSSLAAISITIFLSLSTVGVYRAFFSPLSKFPGPRLWAVTRLPMLYYLGTGDLPYKIHELHKKYGPVVRLAPREVSFINEEAWNDIYAYQKGADGKGRMQLQKDPLQFMPNTTGIAGLLFETDDGVHNRLRRNLSHAFSEKSMRDPEPIVVKYIDKLIVKLHEYADKPVDIVDWYNYVSFDLIGDLVFGESFNCLDTNSLHTWIHSLIDWVTGLALMGLLMRFKPAFYVLQFLVPKHQRDADYNHREMTRQWLDRRLKMKETRNDFLDYIIQHLDTPDGISYAELLETCRVLVTGGSETTANVLSAEIRSAFKDASEINMASVSKLEYLGACISEGLRMFPPLPGNMRRYTPKEGSVIAGTWVPGDTMVAVDQYATYFSPTHFHRPDDFIPERWLPTAPAEHINDKLKAVQAFSVGPRNCIGETMAYMEMRLILTRVLFDFDLTLMEESRDWNSRERLKAFGFWKKPELMVALKAVR